MIVFGGSCEQCDFNSSCTHQKLLWDGEQYVMLPAICRTTEGDTYYHKGYLKPVEEPMDWFLWATIKKKGWVIYGREQFIRADSWCDNNKSSHLVAEPKEKEDPPPQRPLKLGPLKSVYADTTQLQGDLF